MNTARLVDVWGSTCFTFGFDPKDGPLKVLALNLLLNWSDMVNIPDDSYFLLKAENCNGTVVWCDHTSQFDIVESRIQYEGLK